MARAKQRASSKTKKKRKTRVEKPKKGKALVENEPRWEGSCKQRTIAIVNQKGGVGKTTTTVNLAAALAEKGRRVLLIDLDPQANTTRWFGIQDDNKSLFEILVQRDPMEAHVLATSYTGIDLVPASPWLVNAERILAGELGPEGILQESFRGLPKERWDYILLDCPPTLGLLVLNALVAVEELLVPVEPHAMSLDGLTQLLKTVEVVCRRLNPSLRLSGILACRVDPRTRHAQVILQELRKHFPQQFYETVIRNNIRITESFSFQQPIITYDKTSRGAQDYLSLAREILSQEEPQTQQGEEEPVPDALSKPIHSQDTATIPQERSA